MVRSIYKHMKFVVHIYFVMEISFSREGQKEEKETEGMAGAFQSSEGASE
jgi:hypothetical protein